MKRIALYGLLISLAAYHVRDAQPAFAGTEYGWCILSTTASDEGPGCCSRDPPVCEWEGYTYVAECNMGPYCAEMGGTCSASAWENRLAWYFNDCAGDCSNPPEGSCLGAGQVGFAWMPRACECNP